MMTEMQERVNTAASLCELRDILNSYEEPEDEQIELCVEVDLTSLPTFGGEEPANTLGVWSWDEKHLLVCNSINRFEIEDRVGMTIRTDYWRKPIPTDRYDWSAVTDDYEPGCPVGWGSTEADAIADLKAQLEEEGES